MSQLSGAALDAMRAQFANQAAFHAEMGQPGPGAGALSLQGLQGLPGLPGLPGFTLPGLGGMPGAGGYGDGGYGGGAALQALLQAQQQQQQAGLAAALGAQQRPPGDAGFPPPSGPSPVQQAQHRQAAEAQRDARMVQQKKEDKSKQQEIDKKQADKLRCFLHANKPNAKCKKCQKFTEFMNGIKETAASESRTGRQPPRDRDAVSTDGGKSVKGDSEWSGQATLEIANPKNFGFSPLLQSHIVESAHFKALMQMETLEQMIEEMNVFVETIEPYMPNSNTMPSALFVCLYRLFTMNLQVGHIRKLLEYQSNVYVRCVAFLYIRFGLNPEQLWVWLGEYVLDDQELRSAKDSEWKTTVGEFVEGLLIQDKYYSTPLPRLPVAQKRQLEAKLAPVPQCRKRGKANKDMLDVYREDGVRVEANIGGDWRSGVTVTLLENRPSRIKVLIRLDDAGEEEVHLGRVILSDRKYANYVGQRRRSRSRSRDNTDWARVKGKNDKELVDEMRKVDREKAVCTSGKDYARKPLGYKAACALPREQGQASHRLMEEETFVPMKQARRRSPSPGRQEQDFRKAPSQEHQQRMQQLFEKYGMAKGSESGSSRSDLDGPDVMRFG